MLDIPPNIEFHTGSHDTIRAPNVSLTEPSDRIEERSIISASTPLDENHGNSIPSSSSLAHSLLQGAQDKEMVMRRINQRVKELRECGGAHIQEQLHQCLFMKVVMKELLLLHGGHFQICPGVCYF